jgi:hypothetical protein
LLRAIRFSQLAIVGMALIVAACATGPAEHRVDTYAG